MVGSLLPVGNYPYDKDEYSFDEAWENLEKCFQDKEFIVCYAVNESEDGKYLNLEYHNIRGKIFRGYLTQNRKLHNDYFVGKTFCVAVHKLNEREKTFEATHIPVEKEARKQLFSVQIGEKISGNIAHIGGAGFYVFVDVKEGVMFFVSAKRMFWRPIGCYAIDKSYSIGDVIDGTVNFLESKTKPKHSTFGALTCLNFEEKWDLETEELKVGTIVKGLPRSEILSSNMYYIPHSQHVYIEFYSENDLSEKLEVSISITEIDKEKHLVKAKLIQDTNVQEVVDEAKKIEKKDEDIIEEKRKKTRTGSLFNLEIKATISPFVVRINEEIEFESTPNESKTFYEIQRRIKNGQINKLHFAILKAINLFVFCTSKQIMAWLYCNGELPDDLDQDKLNSKLESMSKLGLVDRIRFKSSEGEGIYRVYFLNKNGEMLLTAYLGTKRISYDEAMLATPVTAIKRYLATNQIILAYKEKFNFFYTFKIRKYLMANENTPVRPSAVLYFSNCRLLLDAWRRYNGWKEDMNGKLKRYSLLFENHQKGILPEASLFLLKSKMYLLIVCEDMEHAYEIYNLFLGHEIYPFLLFTYDLLIFKKDINYSVFRFEGIEKEPVYYNVTELLCFHLFNKELVQQNNEEIGLNEELQNFRNCLSKGYSIALEYLQQHDNDLLKRMVLEELQDLYCIDDNGTYSMIYPEEQQYYIYLFYVIRNNLIKELKAEFHEGNIDAISYTPKEEVVEEAIYKTEPSSPVELEQAVEKVAQKIYQWCKDNLDEFDAFQITKKPLRQSTGLQYGYDVGINFKYYGESYRIGFECKNYNELLLKIQNNQDARIKVERYAHNLLQFFMHADEHNHNIWVLICPFGDLQNNFYEKLFEKWNKIMHLTKIRAFCYSQTAITCEEFLSIDEEAFQSIYKHESPKMEEEEQRQLLEYIFHAIIGEKDKEVSLDEKVLEYPFDNDDINMYEQMTLKTVQGEIVSEKIFETLEKNQSIFLIGEYGSGKTCMTHYIVRTIQEHQEVYPYIPLWLKLSNRSQKLTSENLEEVAMAFVNDAESLYSSFLIKKSIQKNGFRVFIILDGMDEIVSGLGGSELKIRFLEQVYISLKKKYGYGSLFLITSRDIDFVSCMNGEENIPYFHRFVQINIGECQREDAIQKIQNIEKSIGENYRDKSITQNMELMSIVQKPLYFGFVCEILLDQDLFEKAVDELDILEAIVNKSVKHYIKNDVRLTEIEVKKRLHVWARQISAQMTEGGSSEIYVNQYNLLSGEKNNVIRLRKIDEEEYGIQFYHNAIREYLVSKELYEKIRECDVEKNSTVIWFEKWLEQIELTPEMLEFFSRFVKKNIYVENQVIMQIIKMIQSTKQSVKIRFGTNLFSILYRLKRDIKDIDFNGIYTNNLYLWHCSLQNINLRNAHMKMMRMFDVSMEDVDFRGADLTGLVIGQNYNISDVQHYRWGNGFRIYVLYENCQLVEYQFLESDNLESYEIIHHATIEKNTCYGICPLENNILYYSDKEIFFESDKEKSYEIVKNGRLLQASSDYILFEQEQRKKLVMHSFKYQEINIISLMENEANRLYILDQRGYLYIDDGRLFLKQNEECYFITYINSEFECFAAIRSMGTSQVIVYIKYSNDIQIIQYTLDTKESLPYSIRLPQCFVFQEMKAIKKDLLYGVSENRVYLFDLSAENIHIYELKIDVRCKNLVLENQDFTERVKGETEYELLKKSDSCR